MPEPKVSPKEIARLAVGRLRAQADPEKAKGTERYFKEAVRSFGVSAPAVRALTAELYGSVRGAWDVDDAVSLCDILFREKELESKAVGGVILSRFKKEYRPSLFSKVESWLASDLLDNWASVDVFCADAMGAFLVKYPASVERIKGWAVHPNRWVKRASAVSFIKLAKRPEFLPAIYEIAESLFPVHDDLIHKANGWLLREAGKTDARRLEAFLLEHGQAIPRTTLRYAIERFPEAKRKTLLARTRKASKTKI